MLQGRGVFPATTEKISIDIRFEIVTPIFSTQPKSAMPAAYILVKKDITTKHVGIIEKLSIPKTNIHRISQVTGIISASSSSKLCEQ